jgi:molecular chaperone HtpG
MSPTDEKKKKVSSSYIPDDIAFCILSKLPVKSVKRFSCVRKSWSLLFENPIFMNMFRSNLIFKSHPLYDDTRLVLNLFLGPDNWNVYLLSGDKFENKVKFDLPPIPEFGVNPTSVLGSAINGVLCLHDYDQTRTTSPVSVVLCNPATGQMKVIPPSLAEFQPEFTTDIYLHGFGYDHVRDDYKVIQLVEYSTESNDGVKPDRFWEMYSLKTNSWTNINFDMPKNEWLFSSDLYFDGVCHWWGRTDNKIFLVSFNLCNDVCVLTPPPSEDLFDGFDVDLTGFHDDLTVLNGFVAIITHCKKTKSSQISILGELGVKESWIRLFHVEPLSCIDHPIGAGKKGNIFFIKNDDELACLDLATGVIEKIDVEVIEYEAQMVIYKENLHPIEGLNN